VKAERDGEILLECPTRCGVPHRVDGPDSRAAAEQLDADELADLAPTCPEVMEAVTRASTRKSASSRAACPHPDDSVGALMDFEMVTVREDVTLEVLRYLRRFDELPDHTDQLFVVDRDEHLRAASTGCSSTTGTVVSASCSPTPWLLEPADEAETAAQAFER
jgi:magnesium transporter